MKTKTILPLALAVAGLCLNLCPSTLRAQSSGLTATIQPTNQTASVGTTVKFNVAVSGSGPFTYQWQLNGTNLPAGLISTVAGNGSALLAGDGGPATNASLWFPYGVAFDSSNNMYIADADNQVVRKVAVNGDISTVAGDGTRGYTGDGVAATSTSLNFPAGVAVDAAGNLYIADDENFRVRKVGTNGLMVTVAGNGTASFSGDDGPATNATLNTAQDVAVDSAGNLYIADTFNNRIRKVGTNGIITTVAGSGLKLFAGDGLAATNAGLYWPSGVAVDGSGNLYIADSLNARIRKVDTNGIITTVAGNGIASFGGDGSLATGASLSTPSAVAVDASGNLYIADSDNNLVRLVSTNGLITTVAGNVTAVGGSGGFSGDGSLATSALLDNPQGLGVDASGNLYVSDTFNNRVREISLAATQPTLTLTAVTAANAGGYSVVITNSAGSVTSAVASLTVTLPNPPPQISISVTNDLGVTLARPAFKISANSGQTVVVEASTNLVTWNPVLTNTMVLTNYYFSDTSATNYAARFLRARLQ